MGNLWINVNYAELQVKMSKVVASVYELQLFLDEAGASETTQPGMCERDNCPNRLKDKGVTDGNNVD